MSIADKICMDKALQDEDISYVERLASSAEQRVVALRERVALARCRLDRAKAAHGLERAAHGLERAAYDLERARQQRKEEEKAAVAKARREESEKALDVEIQRHKLLKKKRKELMKSNKQLELRVQLWRQFREELERETEACISYTVDYYKAKEAKRRMRKKLESGTSKLL